MTRGEFQDLEFVVSAPDPCADETLPEPKDRDWARLRRAGRPVGIVLVLALVGAGVWKLTSFKDGTSTAATAPATTSSRVRPGDLAGASIQVQIPVKGSAGDIISDDITPVKCPANRSCTNTSSAPSDVIAAIRAGFPGAGQDSVETLLTTVDGQPKVLSRTVHAHAGPRLIDIQVVPLADGAQDDAGSVEDGTGLLVYVHRRLDRYTVQVVVHEPRTKNVSYRELVAVATEVGLLAAA